jgi:Xaa-Pro dipeptidase
MHATPKNEIQGRIAGLQALMAENSLDAALILQRADLFYYSGTGQDAHLFVPREGAPILLVRKSFERAVADSPITDISEVKSLTQLKQAVHSAHPARIEALGMELDVLPVNNYRLYEEVFFESRIKDVSPLIKRQRMVKSPYELEIMKRAARLNDEMFSSVKDILKEGMAEMEFAGLLEAFYRKNGHQGYVRVRSFNQEVFYGHVMSGPNLAVPSSSVGPTGGPGLNASMPHGAGSRIIRRHEPVSIDYVGILDGYMVDQARTFFLGDPPERFLRVHDTALSIQNAIAQSGAPGVKAEELYNLALEMAEQAGLSEGFQGYPQPVPFIGHGIGLELDEYPLIGRKSPHVLEPGMAVALEPKFILPGEGLAGIENSFVMDSEGFVRLTEFDDAIQVLP